MSKKAQNYKRVNKTLLMPLLVVLLLTNTNTVNATSGALKQDSIIKCNGKMYGTHGKDNHWHEAKYTPRDKGSDYTAIGDAIYSNPCASQETTKNDIADTKIEGESKENNIAPIKENKNQINNSSPNKTDNNINNDQSISSPTNTSPNKSSTNSYNDSSSSKEEKTENIDKTNEISDIIDKKDDKNIDNTIEDKNSEDNKLISREEEKKSDLSNNNKEYNIYDTITSIAIIGGTSAIGVKVVQKIKNN